ncbi:hypothetical protein [Zavarzinella formosa]|uniref:hypothetical protein n=1 Tax=Zavarzinella formosa TaxID=360055 RepID=UPI0002DD8530|nr:hypothetical protein [Zavarzinella formosa]
MAKSRRKELPSADSDTPTSDTNDFNVASFDPAYQPEAGEIIHAVADSTSIEPDRFARQHAPSGNGHAASIERKQLLRVPDPFAVESSLAGENRVQLLKSEGERAWVIRFAHPPNEDKGPEGESYSKESPHPVIKMLKEAGYRWGFDGGDSKGGWGKKFSEDAFGADLIDARRVLQKAADMIGCKVDQGRIPD